MVHHNIKYLWIGRFFKCQFKNVFIDNDVQSCRLSHIVMISIDVAVGEG